MKWYRINVNFLWTHTDENAIEYSAPAGKDKAQAIEKYQNEINKNMYCCDNKSKPVKIDLTEYIYSKKTNKTRTVIICKNY